MYFRLERVIVRERSNLIWIVSSTNLFLLLRRAFITLCENLIHESSEIDGCEKYFLTFLGHWCFSLLRSRYAWSCHATRSPHQHHRNGLDQELDILERFSTVSTWRVDGKSVHVILFFPPFFTFAGCALPFLRESNLFRVGRVNKIFFTFSHTKVYF